MKGEIGTPYPPQPRLHNQSNVPNALWPSDNDWGIPTLHTRWQAQAVIVPVLKWGSYGRRRTMYGTWHFFTDDWRFEGLWSDPTPVRNTQPACAVEPNFSCHEQLPLAVGIYRIYQKRWISRYWQTQGILIFVDLFVADKFAKINLLGVPYGWTAYATRAKAADLKRLIERAEIAKKHAAGNPITLLVYAGGKGAGELCKEQGWVWIPDPRS